MAAGWLDCLSGKNKPGRVRQLNHTCVCRQAGRQTDGRTGRQAGRGCFSLQMFDNVKVVKMNV